MKKYFHSSWVKLRLVISLLIALFQLNPGYAAVENDSSERVYALEELDKAPKPIRKKIKKEISATNKGPRIVCTATVVFIVGKYGAVEESELINLKSEQRVFTQEESEIVRKRILDALKLWEFEPGIKDGMPVATKVNLRIPFSEGILEPVAGGDATR